MDKALIVVMWVSAGCYSSAIEDDPTPDRSERCSASISEPPTIERHDNLRAAQEAYDQLVQMRFPEGLDFSGSNEVESKRRFVEFVKQTLVASGETSEAFLQAVADETLAPAIRTAACRNAARSIEWLVLQLEEAEVPLDLRTGEYAQDATNAYCNQLMQEAAPLRERMATIAARCESIATN